MSFVNRAVFSAALTLSAFGAPLAAQVGDTMGRSLTAPVIEVSAQGQVDVVPDRATISISVQTRAATAAASSQQNARIQRAVMDTIRTLGIAPEQISTTGYQVYPEYRQERAAVDRPTIIGYNVTNTVRVQVRKLDQIGPVIDASLAKGANMITSLDLYASNTDQARRTAFAQAVERARADAEALARAAGGSLGRLLSVSTVTPDRGPIPMGMANASMRAQAADTPISVGSETLVVHVSARWLFESGR